MRYQFRDNRDVPALTEAVAREWFMDGGMKRFIEPDLNEFSRYTAEGMTRQLTQIFDIAVRGQSKGR
jgi:hypothetical protein